MTDTIIMLVPESAGRPNTQGASAIYNYHDVEGNLVGVIARHDDGSKKFFVPHTYWQDNEGNCSWKNKFWQAPRPIYGLEKLAKYSSNTVIICEGEKSADAAQRLIKGHACMTTSGGSNAVDKSDFSPLVDKDVIIWQDNDEPGTKCAQELTKQLHGIANSVSILPIADGKTSGWDAADALDEGWCEQEAADYLATAIPAKLASEESEDTSKNSNSSNSNEPFPAPVPLQAEIGQAEEYPVASLPDEIRDAVIDYQAYGQQPMSLVATSAISNLSIACQGIVNIARDDNLEGPVSLNSITIAMSGERKTACDKQFSHATRQYQKELIAKAEADIRRKQSEYDSYISERNGIKQQIAKLAQDRSKYADKIAKLEEALIILDEQAPQIPPIPQILYEDATQESLVLGLSNAYPSAALYSDEGAIVIGNRGFSAEKCLMYFGFLNRMWDGSPYQRTRTTQECASFNSRRLTCSLMMQPSVLQHLITVADGQSRDTGFLARVLLTHPKSTMGIRFYKSPNDNQKKSIKKYHKRILELLRIEISVDQQGDITPTLLKLSKDAHKLWVDYLNMTESKISFDGEFADIADFASKSAENAARIAANFHVYEKGNVGQISIKNMQRGIDIAHWLFQPHTQTT